MQTASYVRSATLVIFVLLVAVSLYSYAADPADDYAKLRAAISKSVPGVQDLEIKPSAIENMLEARSGINVFYVSSEGEFLLNGSLYALVRGENLTEKRQAEYRRSLLKDIASIRPIEYPAENTKQKIIVVADIDCPYCRRLHQDLDKYHQAGLDINYVMLPRSGKDSPSYVKTVNAVCAAQPDVVITAAMQAETPAPAACDHRVILVTVWQASETSA